MQAATQKQILEGIKTDKSLKIEFLQICNENKLDHKNDNVKNTISSYMADVVNIHSFLKDQDSENCAKEFKLSFCYVDIEEIKDLISSGASISEIEFTIYKQIFKKKRIRIHVKSSINAEDLFKDFSKRLQGVKSLMNFKNK